MADNNFHNVQNNVKPVSKAGKSVKKSKIKSASRPAESGLKSQNKQAAKSPKPAKPQPKKQLWRPGNMLYPLPAVMVSCADKEGNSNIITIAWTGTICSDPAMLYISVRPSRYSYDLIRDSREFVVNLTTRELAKTTDWCGVVSGRDKNKWKERGLTKAKAETLKYAPVIAESPVNIECKVTEIKPLGSHDMFIAEVTGVQVDEKYMDENGSFDLVSAGLIAYSHGKYSSVGKPFGKFGYSVKKKGKK